jgi:hypothetical protein
MEREKPRETWRLTAFACGTPKWIAFCPDEEFLINPSAKSLGGVWRSWRISEKIRLSRQIALERSSTG